MKTVALYASQPCQKEFLQQFEKLTERQLVYVLENQATQAGLDVSLLTQGGVDIVVEALQNPQQADQVIQAGLNAGITVVATNIAALNRACDVYQNTALDKGAVFITAGAVWGDGRAYLGHLQSESQRLFLLPGGASSTLLNYMRDENIPFDKAAELYAEIHDVALQNVQERASGKMTLRRARLMRQQALCSLSSDALRLHSLDRLAPYDIVLAERMGYTVKLTADIRVDGVDVAPFLFEKSLPLAHLAETDEAVWVACTDHNRLLTYRHYTRALPTSVIADVTTLQNITLTPKQQQAALPQRLDPLYFLCGTAGLVDFCKSQACLSVLSDSLMAKVGREGVVIRSCKAHPLIDQLTAEFDAKIYPIFQGSDTGFPLTAYKALTI